MQCVIFLLLLFDLGLAEVAHFAQDLSTRKWNRPYGMRRRRWDRPLLTWRLDSKNINAGDEYIIRNTLHRAFDQWQAVSAIRFSEKEDNPTDLLIAFERGKHEDQFPFDGRDGIVAHAFFPRDGRLHFDADEEWTLNTPDGVNLFQTAVHEVGHLLGLPHSKDPKAVMNVAKRPYDPEFSLGEDDIRAIQRLYPMELEPVKVSRTAQMDPVTFPFELPHNVRRSQRRQFHFMRV